MRRLACVVSLVTLLFAVSIASAQQPNNSTVPNLIRYGGTLFQSGSAAAAAKITGVTFAIYKQQEGGAAVWLETQNVTPDANGHYSVLLGSTRAEGLSADIFPAQEERWLGVQVQGLPEQPRMLLVSVPYAMKAAEADKLSGHSASEFVTTDNLQSAVQQQLQQQTPKGHSTTSVMAAGVNTNNGVIPAITNPATNFVDSTTDQVVSVKQNGTGMGLAASSPSNVAILGTLNYIAKPGVVAGVEGTSAVNNGYGMFGYSAAASGGIGIHGRSDSPNGIGLQGWAIGTGGIAINATESSLSGSPIGLVARVSAPNATGAFITNVATTTVTGPLISASTTLGGQQFTVSGSGNVSAAGSISGTRLVSTVATGTAPLQVASTTVVPNLNASLLGGSPASAFAPASGSINYIQNGTSFQIGTNFVIDGSGTAGGSLTGHDIRSATNYQIGGIGVVLSLGSAPLDGNLFLGSGAGVNTVPGSGLFNTFTGSNSGHSNTTGRNNVFSGEDAGYFNVDGSYNTFVGPHSGFLNVSGTENTLLGHFAGAHIKSGSNNIDIGEHAGPTSDESNTIRIGTSDQTSTYITGISGAGTTSGVPVFIDATGKLGTTGGSLGGVTSFNGRTGAVVPAANDYDFSQLSGTVGGLQLAGTYTNPLTLNSNFNSFVGTFSGNGAGLTGVPVSAGSPNYIQNGSSQQASASFNIDGNGTVGATVSANLVNANSGFTLSGTPILGGNINNLLVGEFAGQTGPSGWANTFLGNNSGQFTTTGGSNTFVGNMSGNSNTGGANNTFVGFNSGGQNTTGFQNTYVGYLAGVNGAAVGDNTFVGHRAGFNNTTGGSNLFLGWSAGFNNVSGSNDIYIVSDGPGSGNESNTIRIGIPGAQSAAYMQGISGTNIGSGSAVYVSSNGQLGTLTSSRRFKEQIRDMGESTRGLMKLRPVTYFYKPEYDKGPRTLQYGLIAEEVAEVYPELVAYEEDGKPYTVKYQYLTTMLLNELQKQHAVVAAQRQEIESLKSELQLQNAALQDRLSRLESLVKTQMQTAGDKSSRLVTATGGGLQ